MMHQNGMKMTEFDGELAQKGTLKLSIREEHFHVLCQMQKQIAKKCTMSDARKTLASVAEEIAPRNKNIGRNERVNESYWLMLEGMTPLLQSGHSGIPAERQCFCIGCSRVRPTRRRKS